MPFRKGRSGNPAGKPKGAKDLAPRSFRALALRFVQERHVDIAAALDRGVGSKDAHRYLAILASLEKQQHEHEVAGLADLAAQLARKVVHEVHPGPTKGA